MSVRCNTKQDCYDARDELNCTKLETEAALSQVYFIRNRQHIRFFKFKSYNIIQVSRLSIHQPSVTATSLTLFWKMPIVSSLAFQFLPSIIEVGSNTSKWTNNTKWIDKTLFEYTNLKTYTEYNMTVYVRVAGSKVKDGYKPTQYLTGRTSEAGLLKTLIRQSKTLHCKKYQ